MAKASSGRPLTIDSVPDGGSSLGTGSQDATLDSNPIHIECSENAKEKLKVSASQPYLKTANRVGKDGPLTIPSDRGLSTILKSANSKNDDSDCQIKPIEGASAILNQDENTDDTVFLKSIEEGQTDQSFLSPR